MNTTLNETDFGRLIYDEWISSPELNIVIIVKSYVLPVVLFTGIVGNVVAAAMLPLRGPTAAVRVLLGAYLVHQVALLCVSGGTDWLAEVTRSKHVSNTADWCCRLWQFLHGVAEHGAIWCAAAATFERATAALRTSFAAKLAAAAVDVGVVVGGIHAMWTYELTTAGCYVDLQRLDFQTIVWPWFAAVAYQYVPIIVLVVFGLVAATGNRAKPLGNADADTDPMFAGKRRSDGGGGGDDAPPDQRPVLPPAGDAANRREPSSLLVTVLVLAGCQVCASLPVVVVELLKMAAPVALQTRRGFVRFMFARELAKMANTFNAGATYVVMYATIASLRRRTGAKTRELGRRCLRLLRGGATDKNQPSSVEARL